MNDYGSTEKVADAIRDALRSLLEHKHLYQSVRLNLGITDAFESASKAPEVLASGVLERFSALQSGPWAPFGTESADYSGRSVPAFVKLPRGLRLRAPDLKLYCTLCNGVWPFHAADCIDVLSDEESQPTRQILVLRYVCQACKGEPTVFLVRREGLKLTLTGRSPMEHVSVPRVIPPQVSGFYSGAVVAHQSGQTLAGNFLLRTLVEQWVRSFPWFPGAVNIKADGALSWYYDNLPDDFKKRFPSLRETYYKLSMDIHSATGDPTVFADELDRIVKHFEAWRVYEFDAKTFGKPAVGTHERTPEANNMP